MRPPLIITCLAAPFLRVIPACLSLACKGDEEPQVRSKSRLCTTFPVLAALLLVPRIHAQPITWHTIAVPTTGVVAIEHSGSDLFVLTAGSLHHTSDDGISWERSSPTPLYGLDGGYDILLRTPNEMFMGQYSLLWRSTDKGGTWLYNPSDTNHSEQRFWRGQSGQFFVLGLVWGGLGREDKKVYRYGADGALQDAVYSVQSTVHDFCVAPSGDYFIADNGFQNLSDPSQNRPPRVMRRTPADPVWVEMGLPQDWNYYALASVAESRSSSGPIVFIGARFCVWRSSDNGAGWTWTGAGLEGLVVRRLAVAPDGAVFAAVDGGRLMYTLNDGDSWIDASSGLPVAGTLVDMAFDGEGHIYVADAQGVYKSAEVFTVMDRTDVPGIPEAPSLDQNYPNPFNPSTTMRYALPERSHVILTVFNTLGQRVATLVEGDVEAGYHEVKFDASDLASGVYLYRLIAGDYVLTRKLMVLR